MDGHTNSHPEAHTAADSPPLFPRPNCYCAYSGCSPFTRFTPAQCGHTAESVERLTHRASFAESAFYAILHSHGLKGKDGAVEAPKMDMLTESVNTLAQQLLALTKSLKLSNESLQEKLDVSQTTHESNLKDMQSVMKSSIEELRAEFRNSTTILLEDLRIDMLGAVTDLQNEVRDTRDRLSQREAELAEAKGALAQEKLNQVVADHDVRLLAEEVFRLTKSRAEDAVQIQQLRLQAQKQSFAVRQIAHGRFAPEEWAKNAPEELVPLDLGAELETLGRKLSEECEFPRVTSHDDVSIAIIEEPTIPPTVDLQNDGLGPVSVASSDSRHEPEDHPADRPASSLETDTSTDEPPHTPFGSDTSVQSSSGDYLSSGSSRSSLNDDPKHVMDLPAPQQPVEIPPPSTPAKATTPTSQGRIGTAIRSVPTNPQMTRKDIETGQHRIELKEGETITNIVISSDPMWLGTNSSGKRGYFKSKHVRLRWA